ncbi:hypothetical protein MIR68_000593 [Amoeboaphelidium protococcarum]|nr:hypothetical protein MIR68_000593 [Amoeboaphelidium protococcarum]
MIVQRLANAVGASEEALRLMVGILLSIVISFVWFKVFIQARNQLQPLHRSQLGVQHLVNISIGLWLAWFLYGADFIHFPIAITGCWSILYLTPSKRAYFGHVSVCIFIMAYLLVSYYFYSSVEDYSVDFTTSFCVLTLRLIGFSFDCLDGVRLNAKNGQKQNGAQINGKVDSTQSTVSYQSTAGAAVSQRPVNGKQKTIWDNVELTEMPSLVETLSYCMFFNGFIVGPQLPFKAFIDYMTLDKFSVTESDGKSKVRAPNSINSYALRCFIYGVLYIGLQQALSPMFPSLYMATKAFANENVLMKCFHIIMAGRICLMKYLGVWLLNETGCVLSGLSFNGYAKSESQSPVAKWDGLVNVDPFVFETLTCLNNVVQSFNINTNLWSKNYVFKRLKFLNSKNASALGTLQFLAIWHGFAFGYFGAFGLEFLDMESERIVRKWLSPVHRAVYQNASTPAMVRYITNVVMHLATWVFNGIGVVTFDLLTYGRVTAFWRSTWYLNHILVASVIAADNLLGVVFKSSKSKQKVSDQLKKKE